MAEVRALLVAAGWPGTALVLASFLLWVSVWLRGARLRPSVIERFAREAADLEKTAQRALRDRSADALSAYRDLLRALVVVAPLLGLLGTVGGMIELFDALHGAAQVGRGSVASGISTALVTTQLGLVVGVPGLVAARLLEERERSLKARLDELFLRLQDGRSHDGEASE